MRFVGSVRSENNRLQIRSETKTKLRSCSVKEVFGLGGLRCFTRGQPHEMRSGYLVYSWMCEKNT